MHEARKGASVSHWSPASVEDSGPTSAARPWVCVPYVADTAGQLGPIDVEHCPWSNGLAACRLSKHSWRDRKKPGGLRLRVLCCKTHAGRYFTVYPPSLTPYARESLAPLELSGHLQQVESIAAKPGPDPRWRATSFPGGHRLRERNHLASGVCVG